MKVMQFVAVCAYPGLKEFGFFSPVFEVSEWSELESTGKAAVDAAWREISPHPAPEILRFEPGALVYVRDDTGTDRKE